MGAWRTWRRPPTLSLLLDWSCRRTRRRRSYYPPKHLRLTWSLSQFQQENSVVFNLPWAKRKTVLTSYLFHLELRKFSIQLSILIHSETWEIWTLLLIGEICVSGKSVNRENLYRGNLCNGKICVPGKSVYRGNLCIGEICVPGKYVYRGNMCIGEICVSGKYVNRSTSTILH